MDRMYDMNGVVDGALKGAKILYEPFAMPSQRHRDDSYTGAFLVSEPSYGAEGYSEGGFSLGDRQGGFGGDMRGYVPQQDVQRSMEVPEDTTSKVNNDGVDRASIESASNSGDIKKLLAVLQLLATMSPSQGGDPVFSLDSAYKGSSPLGGMQGTPAGYPSTFRTRETEY